MIYPEFKKDFMWLIRLDAFWYALLAFTLSFAGYEGEIMRGAFLGVPRGELEAARAFGMSIHYHNRRRLRAEVEGELEATYWESLDQMVARMDILVALGCEKFQGYLHGKPMPISEVAANLLTG